MKHLICWIIGHSIDVGDCEACECFRCGFTFDWRGPRPREDTGFWLTLWKYTRWIRHNYAFRNWLKCPDCDRRFGRHKNNCMPF